MNNKNQIIKFGVWFNIRFGLSNFFYKGYKYSQIYLEEEDPSIKKAIKNAFAKRETTQQRWDARKLKRTLAATVADIKGSRVGQSENLRKI